MDLSNEQPGSDGPLAGVRIVDLTTMVSGPMATSILADQGAEVIKVESPRGDEMRYIGNQRNGVTAGFFSCNRGKRSLCLDLKQAQTRQPLDALIGSADILVQNFRPGAIDRMGYGEARLRALNPQLIYVSISGFGEAGPYSDQRVYDPVIQALTGATDIQMDRATGTPKMFRIIIADKVTALTAAQAMSAALFARERSGQGQHLKLNMQAATIAFFWPEGMSGLTFVGDEIDVTRYQGTMDLIYRTRDGYITAGAISDKEWHGLCEALGRPDWIADERFASTAARFRNAELRKQLTAEQIETFESDVLLKRLRAQEVPCAPLLSRMELLEHEQVVANDVIGIYEFEGHGAVRQARPPTKFTATPSEVRAPAPRLGEHTTEVLSELGLKAGQIDALLEAGAASQWHEA